MSRFFSAVVTGGWMLVGCSSTTSTPSPSPSNGVDASTGAPSPKNDGGSTTPPPGDPTSSACTDECKVSLCGPATSEPTAQCQACLDKAILPGGACHASVSAACTADPDCLAEQTCLQKVCGGAGGATADQNCANASQELCTQCCISAHEAGYQTFLAGLLNCACTK